MSENLQSVDPKWAQAVAQASAWLALLHDTERTAATDKGAQTWLAESEINKQAFEEVTNAWTRHRNVVRRAAEVKVVIPRERGHRANRLWSAPKVASAVGAITMILAGVALYFPKPAITTEVGEQRTVFLEDGSNIELNTVTRVTVNYGDEERGIELLSGEAMFHVKKGASQPFVLTVGDRKVTAVGTKFLVRWDARRLAVTVFEGKVEVTPLRREGVLSKTLLNSGQRLTFTDGSPKPELDYPVLSRLVAWQSGNVDIDGLPLSEAADEMNRYSRAVQLEVTGPRAPNIRIKGTFKAGDSSRFANAVARAYGLRHTTLANRIVLSDLP